MKAGHRQPASGHRPRSKPPVGTPAPARETFLLDRVAFAIFVFYVILAFTTAIPNHFTLPKLLGVHLYATFAGLRWWQRAHRGDVRRPSALLVACAAALVLWAIVATANAQHVSTSLFGLHGRYNGLFTMLAGIALFMSSATQRLPDREIASRLRWAVIPAVISSAYALLQAAGVDVVQWPQGRPAATMGNPVVFGGILALVLPFLLVFIVDDRGCVRRLGWTASALAVLLALATTLARGPWFGAALGIVTLLALSTFRSRAAARPLAAAALALLLLSATAASVHGPVRARLVSRLATLTTLGTDRSMSIRSLCYTAAVAMCRDHPVTGVGFENFALLYPRYRSTRAEVIAPDVTPTMVHSNPLQVAVETGATGLLLVVALACSVCSTIARRWKQERDDRQRLLGAAFVGAFVAHIVAGLSGWPDIALGVFAWLLGGLGVAWGSNTIERAASRSAARGMAAAALVMCVLGASMARDTWLRIRADRLMATAREAAAFQPWWATRRTLDRAIAASADKAWACDAAAALCVHRVVDSADRTAYEQGTALARQAWSANRFDPYLRLRRVEIETAALTRGVIREVNDDARQAMAAAKSLDPNNATVYEWEARLALAAGRPAEATAAIEKALALRPGSPRYRAIAADIGGDSEGSR